MSSIWHWSRSSMLVSRPTQNNEDFFAPSNCSEILQINKPTIMGNQTFWNNHRSQNDSKLEAHNNHCFTAAIYHPSMLFLLSVVQMPPVQSFQQHNGFFRLAILPARFVDLDDSAKHVGIQLPVHRRNTCVGEEGTLTNSQTGVNKIRLYQSGIEYL